MEIHIEELKRIMNESLNIKGRADRRAFVTLFVFTFIVSSIASRLSSALSGIVLVLFFIPQLSMNIRRLHDTNTSGKWLILPYVLGTLTIASFFLMFFNLPMFLTVILATSTIISLIYVSVKLLFEPGNQEPNKYGPPLKRTKHLIDHDVKEVE